MTEMQAAIYEVATPIIQMWLFWIMAIFVISILFIWKHKAARFVLAAIVLTLPIALVIFKITKAVHLIGIAHIIVWGPLAFYLIKNEVMGGRFEVKSLYGIWMILLLSTIVISLLFDVRDVALVALGKK